MKNFNFKKSLGQNFLTDNNITEKIIKESDIEPKSLIIEIGPGAGALTKELVLTSNQVVAFEIDTRLKDILSQIKSDKLEIIYEDFLKVDLTKYLKKYKYSKLYVIANLPYYITTPIITKLINQVKPDSITIMVQKEVGDRINAKTDSKNYNSLSIFSQYNYNIRKICDVSKNVFIPKPNVDSIVLNFKKIDRNIKVKNEDKFFQFVRDSFQYKRKNLRNNLKKYDLKKLEEILKKYNKDLSFRAEQITIEEFINIFNDYEN